MNMKKSSFSYGVTFFLIVLKITLKQLKNCQQKERVGEPLELKGFDKFVVKFT